MSHGPGDEAINTQINANSQSPGIVCNAQALGKFQALAATFIDHDAISLTLTPGQDLWQRRGQPAALLQRSASHNFIALEGSKGCSAT